MGNLLILIYCKLTQNCNYWFNYGALPMSFSFEVLNSDAGVSRTLWWPALHLLHTESLHSLAAYTLPVRSSRNLGAFPNLQCRWAYPEIGILQNSLRFGPLGRELTLVFRYSREFCIAEFLMLFCKRYNISFEEKKRHQIYFPIFSGSGTEAAAANLSL